MKKQTVLTVAMLLFVSAPAVAETGVALQGHQGVSGFVASDHAPIGVMGDHLHGKGEWMLSYRYMTMEMDGMMDGDSALSAPQVFARGFAVTPTRMRTEMHMFGGMYAPTDDLTLMAMTSYVEKEMDHRTGGGAVFRTSSEGIGDIKLSALYGLYRQGNHTLLLNGGISLPTGSTDERDVTPASAPNKIILPYPMQIGTGTFDLLPGLTYTGHDGPLGWGAQYRAELRLGENSDNYKVGNLHQVSTWGSYDFADWVSSSLRLTLRTQDDISGADPRIGVGMVPTATASNHGGERVDVGWGLNLIGQSGALAGHRLATEIMIPVYQNLNGPQMKGEVMGMIGWQKAF